MDLHGRERETETDKRVLLVDLACLFKLLTNITELGTKLEQFSSAASGVVEKNKRTWEELKPLFLICIETDRPGLILPVLR